MRIEPRTPQPEPPQAEIPAERPKVMVGILMEAATEEQLSDADLDEGSEAIFIQGVVPGLPAEKAGIREGDLVTEIDGKKPATQERLREVLMGKKPGDTVSFTVHRESGDKAIRVRLEKYDPDKLPMPSTPGPENKAFDEAMKQFQNLPKEWPGGTVVVPGPEGQHWQLFTPGHGNDRLAELDKRMAELDEKLSKLNDQMARLEELVEKLSKRKD
jgi:membrane-associated protease RseP (regulator of RpoE activity)